jgi:AraC family transcriptional regulator
LGTNFPADSNNFIAMRHVHARKASFVNLVPPKYGGPVDNTPEMEQPLLKNYVRYLNVSHSDLYRIVAFSCHHDTRYTFKPSGTNEFRINLTQSGYFTYNTYRKSEEEYTNRITVDKPGCEYRVVQQLPGSGSCTMFYFTDEGYAAIQEHYGLQQVSFFSSKNVFSTTVPANAEIDVLHRCILQLLAEDRGNRLELDCLVYQLIHAVLQILQGHAPLGDVPGSTKRIHIKTIERAKDFMLRNFSRDITLVELARHCFVSPFHFTRLFKQFCGCAPFTYLQQVRLKHAELLIRTTDLPVTDVCFRSGFNRLDYFSTSFSKLYGVSPSRYKLQVA